MLVCPSCSAPLPPPLICSYCGWRGQYREGLPVLLADPDLNDEIARSYTENYDRIALEDLDDKVMDPRYVENMAKNFCDVVELFPGAEVCDVGSGKGFLVRKLLTRGAATVTAVDISYAVFCLKKKMPYRRAVLRRVRKVASAVVRIDY